MRKITFVLLLATFCLVFAGCGTSREKQPEAALFKTFPEFKTVDTNDKPISNDIFKQHDLTLVNVWGTYCLPCKDELPALENLSKEMKAKNVNIIGIISDGKEQEVTAYRMMKEMKLTFTNVIPTDELMKQLRKRLIGVPSSMFVNKKGEIVGELVTGARTEEQYRMMLNDLLQKEGVKQ
ncbi:thiol-disulfide isomerase/thioredoxin [Aneurinibacillus soli]|uniref:Thiol-disulfide oxidoreductase ResA n=1 Tax=Aneurinibacillus soli TaxID=1500254 RepID=A0A0U5BKM9_9BACL|nr:TlpA disulfide reductase family protein [Aneurinibacillus soli]PYE62062.1 thiol-disulfide isomerase/thioredoxin [Aneurinibacillus soli]BAU28750.1 Thiol-disulfide oxidoreductase ResA [Aneurinibacillus soli]